MQTIFEEYYRIGYTCTNYDRAKPIADLIDEVRGKLLANFQIMTVAQIESAKRELGRLDSELAPCFKRTHAPFAGAKIPRGIRNKV